jgi:hypothetical protein
LVHPAAFATSITGEDILKTQFEEGEFRFNELMKDIEGLWVCAGVQWENFPALYNDNKEKSHSDFRSEWLYQV